MSSRVGPVVLLRDLRRLGRRWGPRTARIVVVALTALVIAVPILAGPSFDPGEDISAVGRMILGAAFVLLVAMMGVLLPLEVGQAVRQEREEGTLGLLVLTGLPPVRVLAEVVGTRLAAMMLLALATLPLFAIAMSLGGVGPAEILGACLAACAAFIAVIGVSMVAATASRASLLPVLIVAAWLLIFGVLIPARWSYRMDGTYMEVFWAFVIPLPPSQRGYGLDVSAWAGLLTWTTAGVVGALAAGWRFPRMVASGWSWRTRAWPGPALGWIVPVAFVAFAWTLLESGLLRIQGTGASIRWLRAGTVALYGLSWLLTHGLFLRVLAWLLPRLDRPRDAVKSRSMLLMRLLGPVAWREVVTAAHGGISRVLWALTGTWVLVAALVWLNMDLTAVAMWAAVGAWGAGVLSCMLIGLSVADERAQRALPLLTMSAVTATQLARGKVLGAWLRMSPLIALSSLALLGSVVLPRLDGLPVVKPYEIVAFAVATVWFAQLHVVVAVTSVLAASLASRRTTARTLPVILAILCLPAALAIAVVTDRLGHRYGYLVEFISILSAPPTATGRYAPHPLYSVVGLFFWLGLILVLGFVAVRALHWRMHRGEARPGRP